MNIAMQGVIHGRTIELEDTPGLDDGRIVHVIVSTDMPIRPERRDARPVSYGSGDDGPASHRGRTTPYLKRFTETESETPAVTWHR